MMSNEALMNWSVCVCPQLAQSVIELNNQIQQKDKEIQNNEAKWVSHDFWCACVFILIYFK